MNIPAIFIVLSFAVAARAESPKQPRPLNVLIIGADTLRADHLDLYGYRRPTSPNLDRLASSAVVFDQAFAEGAYTLPSFASLFTSRYPEQHGATNRLAALRDSETMLAELFQRAGYRTAGFTGGPNVTLYYGFGKGFDSYMSGDHPRQLYDYIPVAVKWLEKDRSKPFFLFLQPQDVHPPFNLLDIPEAERNRWDPDYDGPAERYMESFYYFRSLNGEDYKIFGPKPSEALQKEMDAFKNDPRALKHMASVYDDRVAHFDRGMGALWKELERLGVLDNTLVVLMSDHGTLFGEAGKFLHGIHMATHDGISHVVLVIWAPGQKPRRVSSPVELVDVAPTIAELAGLSVPKTFEGRSLRPLMDGREDSPQRPVFGLAAAAGNPGQVRHWLRDWPWRFVSDDPSGKTALYDLSKDPDEVKDVSAEHPGAAKRLSGLLLHHLQTIASKE